MTSQAGTGLLLTPTFVHPRNTKLRYFKLIGSNATTMFKSNLFIVTHVHKCTDGEILRYKILCHGSTSNNVWKMFNIHFTQYTHDLHNIQFTHFHNIHIVNCILKRLIYIYIAFIYDLKWCILLVFYCGVQCSSLLVQKRRWSCMCSMQCEICYSAVRVSVCVCGV